MFKWFECLSKQITLLIQDIRFNFFLNFWYFRKPYPMETCTVAIFKKKQES